jgi:hypothetical protein
MTLGPACRSRLDNWKFTSAHAAMLDEQPDHAMPSVNESETVRALMITFGNVGYFSGELSSVVRAAVQRLLDGWPDEPE